MKYTLEQIETVCPPYANFGENAKQLVDQLLEKCKEDNGLGMSANQVGLTDRVFVISCGGKEYGAFNPEFEPLGDKENIIKEGCLSYPGLYLAIKRPAEGRARWQDYNGDWHNETLTGFEARVFQHELDHLNGVPFIKRVSKLKLDRALRSRSKQVKRIVKNMRQSG